MNKFHRNSDLISYLTNLNSLIQKVPSLTTACTFQGLSTNSSEISNPRTAP